MSMKLGRAAPFAVALVLGAFGITGRATSLFTFGGDFTTPGAFGVPDSLNSMDPAAVASVTNVQTPVGDTTIGFNGGLVFAGGQLYAVGNDGNGLATLFSLQLNGLGLSAVSSDFNTSSDAAGVVFQN